MSELAELYTSIGFVNARTYIQSGNVVFSHSQTAESDLADKIHNAIKARLGLDVTVFLRTPKDIERLDTKNPFIGSDQTRMHVTFLHTKPGAVPRDKIEEAAANEESFAVLTREVCLFLPNGQGMTKLSNRFFEKIFKVPATTRNWKTVLALRELAMASLADPGPAQL